VTIVAADASPTDARGTQADMSGGSGIHADPAQALGDVIAAANDLALAAQADEQLHRPEVIEQTRGLADALALMLGPGFSTRDKADVDGDWRVEEVWWFLRRGLRLRRRRGLVLTNVTRALNDPRTTVVHDGRSYRPSQLPFTPPSVMYGHWWEWNERRIADDDTTLSRVEALAGFAEQAVRHMRARAERLQQLRQRLNEAAAQMVTEGDRAWKSVLGEGDGDR
jgi:hypothetical protein